MKLGDIGSVPLVNEIIQANLTKMDTVHGILSKNARLDHEILE